jgi:hypothetical protein
MIDRKNEEAPVLETAMAAQVSPYKSSNNYRGTPKEGEDEGPATA